MNIIFLDFDGVCNGKQHLLMTSKLSQSQLDSASDPNLLTMKHETNSMNMWVLGYILDNVPDLKIVISSSWRNHYDIESFKELFKIYGLDGERIIGKTPRKFSSTRANEIHMYLDDLVTNNMIDLNWAALDDHKIWDIGDDEEANEFLTDSWIGLTMRDAFEVIEHFNPNFKEPIINI